MFKFKLDPPAIPHPLANVGSLVRAVSAIKEGLEVVLGVRGGTGVAGGINDEAAIRAAADQKLQAEILAEINARAAAVNNLQAQINALLGTVGVTTVVISVPMKVEWR